MRLSASVVMLSAALSAALTREQVVNPLISIATKSNALIPKVKQVNAINTPLRIIGQGPWPSILTGLDEIITTEKTLALVLDDQEPYFPGFNIAYAVQAFSDELCERQRDLLMNLTEKADTILDVSLVVEKEVSEKLRSTEGYIDVCAVSESRVPLLFVTVSVCRCHALPPLPLLLNFLAGYVEFVRWLTWLDVSPSGYLRLVRDRSDGQKSRG